MAIEVEDMELDPEQSPADRVLGQARVIVALEQALDTVSAWGGAPEATQDLQRALKDAIRLFAAHCGGMIYTSTGKLLS